ncbi:VPLPA-CTERM sorting domain-containing protein [Albidovulum aquaemixtae]|nr:VPLPA-CTERM sorting domain-containing protein [Defluviimonas aquaemixtae]
MAAVIVTGSAFAALAATFNGSFTIGGNAFSSPGLVVNASPTSGPLNLNLTVGQSVTFDLFDIWTNDPLINGSDTTPQSIFVDFDIGRSGGVGALNGTTQGNTAFIFQYGSVNWQAPLMLAFGNGGLMQISLSNEIFNFGVFGLSAGQANGATVQATATLIAAPVPLPAAGLGLLAGLGGLALVRRRRMRDAA